MSADDVAEEGKRAGLAAAVLFSGLLVVLAWSGAFGKCAGPEPVPSPTPTVEVTR